MTTLPAPVPLDPPSGDPTALADLVSAVTGAAFGAGVLTAHLAGPAASAPGWLGADAAEAAGQVVAVAGLVQQVHGSLTAAEQRLRAHAAVLDDARGRIAALRRQQAEDFAVAWAHLAAQADPDLARPTIQALEAAEADRRRAHAAAVAEVTADATATAQVLDDGTIGLGGTGARGLDSRVRVHLATLLPGWGDAELTSRAWAATRALDGPVTAEEIDTIVREGMPYAGAPAYAEALLANLGEDGVRWLLADLGQGTDPSGVLARWLATAFGAARPGSGPGALSDVLNARYIDPASTDGTADQIAFGLTALLTAVPASAGGVRNETAAGWGVQMLARERRQGVAASERLLQWEADPVEVVVDRLAAAADPAAAAVLLGGPDAWHALLARSWEDGGVALGVLVRHAAAAGPVGDAAVRSGLEALGTGLSPLDDVAWTVDRTTASQLTRVLGDAVAAHPRVAIDLLAAAGTGDQLLAVDDAALRGLGYLTLDPDTAAAVQSAVDASTADTPLDLAGTDATAPAEAVAIRSALVAAREYAQRLEYAIDGDVALSDAVDREFTYDVTVRLPVWAFGKIAGLVPGAKFGTELLDAVVDGGAWLLNADGGWELGPDEGLVFDREDAADAVAPLDPGTDPATTELIAGQARAAFDRTLRLLGHPEPPDDPGLTDSLPDRADFQRTQLEQMHIPGHR